MGDFYIRAFVSLVLQVVYLARFCICRTLANYLIWRIMMNRVTNLPEKYRELRNEYHKVGKIETHELSLFVIYSVAKNLHIHVYLSLL